MTMMITMAGFISIVTSAGVPPSSPSSQTPAIVALGLALVSMMSTLYAIYRQNRNDKVANAAVHSTAANEASKQSFEQLMQVAQYQERQIIELHQANRLLTHRVDELENQVDLQGEELAVVRNENRRLSRLVVELGGTP